MKETGSTVLGAKREAENDVRVHVGCRIVPNRLCVDVEASRVRRKEVLCSCAIGPRIARTILTPRFFAGSFY